MVSGEEIPSGDLGAVTAAAPIPGAMRRQEATSTEITRHLLQYLLSGSLRPGQKIPPERRLAEALGIGRSSVREAIKSLSLLGLLDVRQGDGTYLTSSTSDLLPQVIEWGLLLGERRVTDLVEARSHMEVFIAGLAAERRAPENVARLRAAVDMMRSAGADRARYVEGDVEFHREVARASGNEVLANLSTSFQSLLRVWAGRIVETARETESLTAEHEPIADAIEQGDVDGARAAMTEHMQRAAARLQDALAGRDQAPA